MCKYHEQARLNKAWAQTRVWMEEVGIKAETSHVQREDAPPTPTQTKITSQLIPYPPVQIKYQCFVVLCAFSVDVFPGYYQCTILLRTVHCKLGIHTMHNETALSTTWHISFNMDTRIINLTGKFKSKCS